MVLGALVEPGEGRVRGNLLPTLIEAFHRAEGEAQRERRIRVAARAFEREAGLGDLRVRLLLGLALSLHDLAQRAGFAVH